MRAPSDTPETDAFMGLIDDSEIDIGMVETKLGDMERRLADAVRERDEAKEDAERLATDLDFILNECDWEENAFGKSGDNRIGTVCKEALKYK